MDPRLTTQRRGGIIVLMVFVLAIGITAGVLLATGLDWVPHTNAVVNGTTAPGDAADVTPGEFLVQSQENFRNLVAAVRPAVVSIQAEDFNNNIKNPYEGLIDPFEFFGIPRPEGKGFGTPQGPDFQQEFPMVSSGSGFIVSADGYVLTNNHVVDGADTVKVILDSGENYDAEIIGTDPDTDVAVLKIGDDNEEFPYLEFGDVGAIEVGDWVMAVGNPFGNLAGTVTVGIISATGREYLQLPGDTYYQNFIQTDAAINFGNSGGPLVDMHGKVIGINTAISSQGSGIGFATPIDLADFVYTSFLEYGEVIRGWIGVTIHNLDNDLADALGLDSTEGTIIAAVTPDQPADRAGLKEGDVILEVDGQHVTSTATASRLIAELPVDKPAEMQIWRDGEPMTIEITPIRRALNEPAPYDESSHGSTTRPQDKSTNEDYLGMSVRNLTNDDITTLELPSDTRGVVIESVEPGSIAFEKGLRSGNVIVEIANQPVNNLDDYSSLMSEAKDRWDNEGKMVIIRYLGYGSNTGWVRSFMAIPFE